ncbi:MULTISPECIES: DUF4177 domain-containing protein [unclassified Thermosynechococcus]|uniref:DUF4177 domain-containing protein n=1 Tax=unclassified Thermosynechococcus TaxID=2622553 RepID=UPI002673FE0E|nr:MULTISPECIES: DUF4177 domain-containing protein [unclassified Thermosynechococcus]WKT83438.1 DUF4177 domain-containing protein [Thermosynechococcus sp. HY596]WNC62569.1 DUF4177 domain-containing protein [Thermosynechococcus sp. HY591]WNC65125.1 DUF4177 domain-containing protein [Thermosynechococcus sp. HY593]
MKTNLEAIKQAIQGAIASEAVTVEVSQTGSQLTVIFNRPRDKTVDFTALADQTVDILNRQPLGRINFVKFYGRKTGGTPEWEYAEPLSPPPPQAVIQETLQTGLSEFGQRFQFYNQTITAASALAIFLMLLLGGLFPNSKWEYKTVYVTAKTVSLGAYPKFSAKEVSLMELESEVEKLGKQGWELVDSFVEDETVHPNFGNEEYVTGLQPNVRPNRVVLLFKRKTWF